MTIRGQRTDAQGFEEAQSGTIYWTLSLYIEADKVAQALGLKHGERVAPSEFRRLQRRHLPSLALANAIDPLMNDIADREMQGEVQEFLLAVMDGEGVDDLTQASEGIRDHKDLIFKMPKSASWTTEGVSFHAHPEGLDDDRAVRLRRFWLSHNNGALSYHLSFSHYYGGTYLDARGEPRSGYGPSTYYFLSMLQKLAAPKEYALDPKRLQPTDENPDPFVTVFSETPLDIDPLDNIRIQHVEDRPGTPSSAAPTGETRLERFWPFVKTMFEGDAVPLFRRLAAGRTPVSGLKPGFEQDLLDPVSFMETPGLKVPKSRFMFMLHDERFFDRLMPLDPDTKEIVARKRMVQPGCYEPYQEKIRDLMKPIDGRPPRAVHLGRPAAGVRPGENAQTDYWEWAERRERDDCLDYLFLAGFNQNIIDFMNQDTSEILDSIDPIYPDSSEQSDERFFIRYANHRAMITYVPRSRSLEIGNDYIGACPYAFLIHALALHNEFLARGHEQKTMARIARIEALVDNKVALDDRRITLLSSQEPLNDDDRLGQAEFAINQAKLAEFSQYERFRHANPFRYDTERDVFRKLEELRGISRKNDALSLAIKSLEDHAADLSRRQQRKNDDEAARRGQSLNILLGMTGIFGAGQMFYWIGEKTSGKEGGGADLPTALTTPVWQFGPSKTLGAGIMAATEVAMILALAGFIAFLLVVILGRVFRRKPKEATPPN